VKRTEVNSKWIVTELLKFTPTFRTKQFDDGSFPPTKIPEFIFELPKQDIVKILQAMFSSDGSVTISVKWEKRRGKFVLRRRVKLASKHPKLKEQISFLLQKLGFHPRIHSDSVVLERKEDLIKFQKEVRFVDGVKVTKNGIWSGMDKNNVLDILVKTFEIPQSFIDKFSSKEEIINFLKTL
jgi:intein/homing endonuclease